MDALKQETQQVEAKAEEIVHPQSPVTPEAPTTPEVTPEAPVVQDRSAYNCVPCNGEGLTADHKALCDICKGTGKV